MKNIAFILTTLDSHARHRVDDFVAHGFDVHVYSFTRTNEKQSTEAPWPVEIIGSFPNSLPYHKRLSILYKGIRSVALKYEGQKDVCFYYLGLDIAMIATFAIKHPYIFEECDLNHTYIGNSMLRKAFEKLDCHIIKNSLRTVFTSEGFFSFHNLKDTSNISLIANKLPESIKTVELKAPHKTDINHLSFGFAGSVRYETITSFASILVRNYPQHEFHFFGNVQECVKDYAKKLEEYPNCHFHGRFQSPVDLPEIYSQLDFTLATYDTRFENVRYAEPNKMYEAVYFRTPVIVSKGTFLAEKAEKMKMGFAVDALDEADVKAFVDSLTIEKIEKAKADIAAIPTEYAIDNNEEFFRILKEK